MAAKRRARIFDEGQCERDRRGAPAPSTSSIQHQSSQQANQTPLLPAASYCCCGRHPNLPPLPPATPVDRTSSNTRPNENHASVASDSTQVASTQVLYELMCNLLMLQVELRHASRPNLDTLRNSLETILVQPEIDRLAALAFLRSYTGLFDVQIPPATAQTTTETLAEAIQADMDGIALRVCMSSPSMSGLGQVIESSAPAHTDSSSCLPLFALA